MDYFEITYEEELSDCCGARIYADIMMCEECKEYCKPLKPSKMKQPLKELLARIEVKSVKFHRGHDGMDGLNCKLYVDGKFVAHVHDDAYGGGNHYDQFLKHDKEGMPIITEFDWMGTLEGYDLKYTSDLIGGEPLELEHCWDSLVDLKVNEAQKLKDANKGVMFQSVNGVSIVGYKCTIPNAFKKWGKAEMLKEYQRIYDTKVSEGKEILNKDYLQSIGLKL